MKHSYLMWGAVGLVGTVLLTGADRPPAKPEIVATFDGPMPTGVTVSRQGRIFINYPRWGDAVVHTVGELRDGKTVAYPPGLGQSSNPAKPETDELVSVQSVVVDPADRLWILDTGSVKFGPTRVNGPKLISVDLNKDQVIQTITFPPAVVHATSYLNDVRFDLRRGKSGMAFITDSAAKGGNGIVVVDLFSGRSWRRLHDHVSTRAEAAFIPVVEGKPLRQDKPKEPPTPITIGSDGIAISSDGERLYYCPLASRKLYSVSVDALADEKLSNVAVAATVMDHGAKGASDGLESDDAGRLYLTDYEHNAIHRRGKDGRTETIMQDPRAIWPDTLSLAYNGYLYFTANQLNRQADFHDGKDLRVKPYYLFRVSTDGEPVMLLK